MHPGKIDNLLNNLNLNNNLDLCSLTLTEESQVAGAARQGVWSPGAGGEGLLRSAVCGPLPRT